MSERFLFYKPTITSGWNIFYLHLLIGLITSKIYWRIAKNLVPILKRVIQVSSEIIFFWNLYENPNERRKNEFYQNIKARFQENFYFRELHVPLIRTPNNLYRRRNADVVLNFNVYH